jgi:hypothetical protein
MDAEFTPIPPPTPPVWDQPAPSVPTPIACSLDTWALGARADEWQALVAWSVAAVEVDGLAVRLVLRDSEADLTAAVALAQREKQCCPFFDVSVTIEADRRTLVLAVPDGAHEALATFVAMLTP